MSGLKLRFELLAHRLVGEQIIALAGEKPAHRNLVILIRLDSELAPMMPVRNQSLVKLLNRERRGEILGVTMPDVADEAMKYSV